MKLYEYGSWTYVWAPMLDTESPDGCGNYRYLGHLSYYEIIAYHPFYYFAHYYINGVKFDAGQKR